jgi:hypothetical protein
LSKVEVARNAFDKRAKNGRPHSVASSGKAGASSALE